MSQCLRKFTSAAEMLMVLVFLAVTGTVEAQTTSRVVYCAANKTDYQLVSGSYTWQEAYAMASTMKHNGKYGHLAMPKSFDADFCIVSAFGASLHGAWLAGWRERSPDPYATWYWTDGTPFTYTNWSPGNPNNAAGKEDRLQYWHVGDAVQWNDNSHNARGGFVVQYR